MSRSGLARLSEPDALNSGGLSVSRRGKSPNERVSHDEQALANELELALSLVDAGSEYDAERIFNKVADADDYPALASVARMLLGLEHLKRGGKDLAAQHLRRAYDSGFETAVRSAMLPLATLLAAEHRFDEAADVLDQGASSVGLSEQAALLLCRVQTARGHSAAIIGPALMSALNSAASRRAIDPGGKFESGLAAAWFAVGVLMHELGDDLKSASAFRECASLQDPQFSEVAESNAARLYEAVRARGLAQGQLFDR